MQLRLRSGRFVSKANDTSGPSKRIRNSLAWKWWHHINTVEKCVYILYLFTSTGAYGSEDIRRTIFMCCLAGSPNFTVASLYMRTVIPSPFLDSTGAIK